MVDWDVIVRVVLFAVFAALTAAIATITGPTYDGLLVPELSSSALYPPLPPSASGPATFLTVAASFSSYLLVQIVDPAVALIALGVGIVYLGRVLVPRLGPPVEALVPRLVLAVIVANFTLPIAGALLALAGSVYPIVAGFDGGAWQHWQNIGGIGGVGFSWDNGVLAFVVSFAIFSLILLLAAAVALRDALLGVLLVLLPVLTLFWPIPTLAPLARRAWLLFGELAFLPCVLVIPLELAVGAPSILLVLGYLTVALATPSLISLAGGQLTGAGFPSAGSALTGGIQRGLAAGSSSLNGFVRPLSAGQRSQRTATLLQGVGRSASSLALPAGIPVLTAQFLGRGAAHLVRHVPATLRRLTDRTDQFSPYPPSKEP